jgi:hypothetical protein
MSDNFGDSGNKRIADVRRNRTDYLPAGLVIWNIRCISLSETVKENRNDL